MSQVQLPSRSVEVGVACPCEGPASMPVAAERPADDGPAGCGRSASPPAPLRVLLASEPGVDGVFRHVEALAHFLLSRGHAVDLAYSDVRGSDRLERLVADVGAAGGETLNLGVGNGPAAGDWVALARLRRLVRATRPDVIHAHSSKAGALVRALRWLGVRRPFFYTPHAYYGMSARAGLRSRVFTAVERLLGGVGTTLTLSEGERAYARGVIGVAESRLRLIPNPVDVDRFSPAAPGVRRRLLEDLGVPPDALVLGCVGRLAPQKDPGTLYRALALALKEVKQVRLYHLGTGELAGDCARLAAELGIAGRVIRRDYMDDPLPFYHALDGLILTSRYEGLSFAVLEALACDLPVILSEAPGNLDFLGMGLSHCWSASPGDVGGTARAMIRWAADRPAGRPSNHRAIARERFSPAACFGAVIGEYLRAAGR